MNGSNNGSTQNFENIYFNQNIFNSNGIFFTGNNQNIIITSVTFVNNAGNGTFLTFDTIENGFITLANYIEFSNNSYGNFKFMHFFNLFL